MQHVVVYTPEQYAVFVGIMVSVFLIAIVYGIGVYLAFILIEALDLDLGDKFCYGSYFAIPLVLLIWAMKKLSGN